MKHTRAANTLYDFTIKYSLRDVHSLLMMQIAEKL